MKKKYIFCVCICMVILCGVMFLKKSFHEQKSNIPPGLVQTNNITMNDNSLYYSGEVIGNSFYGKYSSYDYAIDGDKLYLYIYSSEEPVNDRDSIEIIINDNLLGNIKEVYLSGDENYLIMRKGQ